MVFTVLRLLFFSRGAGRSGVRPAWLIVGCAARDPREVGDPWINWSLRLRSANCENKVGSLFQVF